MHIMLHKNRQDLGNANANRSFVTLPVFMNAENAEKLIDFIDTKSSAKMKSQSKLTNVQNDRNNEEDKAITQQYLLKFRLADVKVAERLALQLYTICNRVIQNSTDHHNTTISDDHNENNDENIFTRFNRQFRDTFKCFSSPFNVKSKMSKRKSCSTSLDPNATTTQHDANDADNHAEAKITTLQPSSLSDHTSQLSHNIVSSMSTVSMPIPTTSVTFVTSNDSYPVTVKSSLNDNDENIKKWSYSPVYSSIQTNTSTIMTTSTTHHHPQHQQQQQSSNTSTTHTTFISNSKYHQSNIMKTNYEAIPTVVEPVEVAAGEAQAELNERDQQVLQSLLMNKSSTIISSTPINNLSYTVTNTPMMTTSATSMNSMSSSPVSLSSFNNSSSVAMMNKSNTESFNINSANTTITTATTTIQEDQSPKQSLNENLVSSSTMPTSSINSKLKTFPYSSSSQPTEMTSEQKIANSSLTNHSNHGDTSSIVEKPISNGEK
ncbi:unnamed protein product [Schistosoma turkestanicum]|nr:unnamed protein product [Schistosoma turkestanicum]